MNSPLFSNLKAMPALFAILIAGTLKSNAQMTLTGQVRVRGEIRDGLANLVPQDSKQAAFLSQRTRLNFGYKWDRVLFGASVQDVRVWGQDASTISNADGNRLMLHEGWAEITLANKADTTIGFKLVDNLSLKLGRQELIYDDVRLLGNLDWLQQGRRFDMALLKVGHQGWQVDLGFAFNQNTDAFNTVNTIYVPGNVPAYVKDSKGNLVPTPTGLVPITSGGNITNNSSKAGAPAYSNPPSTNGANQDYKTFTSLYISRKYNQTKFSVLVFYDNFGKYRLDSVATSGAGTPTAGYVYGRRFDQTGVNNRLTYGLMVNHTLGNASGFGKIAFQGAYYQQSGDDRDGNKLDAHHYTISALYSKGKFSFGPGYDVLSGNDANKIKPGKSNRFDPLYGTPHKHWGYMDYFYVGTGSPAGGLNNAYFKAKFTTNDFSLGADYHYFELNNPMKTASGASLKKYLGSEIDLIANYTLNKFTNVEFGYSIMKASNSLAAAKSQDLTKSYDKTGKWAYLMINIKPDFFYSKPVAVK